MNNFFLFLQAELSNYVCEHKDAVSSNVGPCCEKPLVERPNCIANLENDVRSQDLPPPSGEILQETEACKAYAEQGDAHLERYGLDIFTLFHTKQAGLDCTK